MTDLTSLYRYLFTVFTPTYNRATTLHRVYESLRGQTFRDFEWLVIDDGSTDNTRDLISAWQREAQFPIRYFSQQNQGKHVAINVAVQRAEGELFLPLDSDDACVPVALERFKYHWETIPSNQRHRFSAVTALCVDQFGRLVGDKFPKDVFDSDSIEITYRYGVTGEKWGFHRTDVLKQYPFPSVDGKSYVPESIVWNAIARSYKTRFVNEELRIYYLQANGVSDQLTRAGNPARHAIGHALWHRSVLGLDFPWWRYAPAQYLRSAVHYSRFSFHRGVSVRDQLRALDSRRARAVVTGMVPLAFGVYLWDRRRTGREGD